MVEPLDILTREKIDTWRNTGVKGFDWFEQHLSEINEIYCNKDTIIRDRTTQISLPISSISSKHGFAVFKGGGYHKAILGVDVSFTKNYSMEIKEFSTNTSDTLKVFFKAYEGERLREIASKGKWNNS